MVHYKILNYFPQKLFCVIGGRELGKTERFLEKSNEISGDLLKVRPLKLELFIDIR